MKYLITFLIFILLGILLTGCTLNENSPNHYIITKTSSSSSSGHSSSYSQNIEIENGKVINGTAKSISYSYSSGQVKCERNYFETESTCKKSLKFENLSYTKLLEDVEYKYNVLKNLSQNQELVEYQKEFIQIYETKQGCNANLCYENGFITRYSKGNGGPTGLTNWNIEILS